MIGPGNGVRVFLAAGITDMRCGIAGLCARAKRALEEDPASGAVFVFRGRMGDRLKILHWVSHWIAIGPRANGASRGSASTTRFWSAVISLGRRPRKAKWH